MHGDHERTLRLRQLLAALYCSIARLLIQRRLCALGQRSARRIGAVGGQPSQNCLSVSCALEAQELHVELVGRDATARKPPTPPTGTASTAARAFHSRHRAQGLAL